MPMVGADNPEKTVSVVRCLFSFERKKDHVGGT
jgi:hypothetical protein